MSPLSEEFLNFQSGFDSLCEDKSTSQEASGNTQLKSRLADSRVQFKPVVSGNHPIPSEVSLPKIGPNQRYKWVVWSAPVILFLAWLMTYITSTPMDSSTPVDTIFDATSQLKAVSFGASGGSHHANSISITILDSMKELQVHASLPPIDSFRSREASNVLESQPNVPNSTFTANHLRDLTILVECVYDSLRQLDGRGTTEIRVLMEEFAWFRNFEAVEDTDKFIRSMFEHQRKTFTLLCTLAESSIGVIEKTHLTNEMVQQDLLRLNNWLTIQQSHSFGLRVFKGHNHKALEPLLEMVRSMVDHTRYVRSYLEKSRLVLQLYHDNSRSWLDTISTRWVMSNKPDKATMIQCVLALHALHTELIDRHLIPTMRMGKTIEDTAY